MSNAELYRCEADRLRSMALAFEGPALREAFLDIARQYEILADQIEGIINKFVSRPEAPET